MTADAIEIKTDSTNATAATQNDGAGATGVSTGNGSAPAANDPAAGSQDKAADASDKTAAAAPRPAPTAPKLGRNVRTPALGANDCLTSDDLKKLREQISGIDAAGDAAEELAAALGLAERIRAHNLYIPGVYDQLTFIVGCLNQNPPRIALASVERLNVQLQIYRKTGWMTRALAKLSDGSPVVLVLSALGISLVLWTVLMLGLQYVATSKLGTALNKFNILFMDGRALGVITCAAVIGGIISIATRINEFSRVRDLDPFAMFWTALFKPLIGVVLAVFILATLEGNILSFGFLDPKWLTAMSSDPKSDDALRALYILWVFGFLAGFSERFAWDFVDRTQSVASGQSSKDTPKKD